MATKWSKRGGLPLVEQPTASPELNPAKRVFEHVRRAVEGKANATLDEKVAAARAELMRIEAHPDRMRQRTGLAQITAAVEQPPRIHTA